MATTEPNNGPQDLAGLYMRKIDASLTGGRNGPQYAAASFSILPVADGPTDLDAYYAVNATAGAVVVTAPPAASTPLGCKITLAKTDASGNAVTFSALDATISNGATTSANTTQGTAKHYTLANLNGTLTWVID